MLRLTDCLGVGVTDAAGATHGGPWGQVETFEPTGVVLRADGRASTATDGDLRLARDVLDAQIVDVA